MCKTTLDEFHTRAQSAHPRCCTTVRSSKRMKEYELCCKAKVSRHSHQSISIHINPYQSISIHINPYQSISIHINPYQSISIHINPYQSISIHINPSISHQRLRGQHPISSQYTHRFCHVNAVDAFDVYSCHP